MFVANIFKSRRRLEAENLFLRHQLNIALRRAPPRLRLYGSDRTLLVCFREKPPCYGKPVGRERQPSVLMRAEEYAPVGPAAISAVRAAPGIMTRPPTKAAST